MEKGDIVVGRRQGQHPVKEYIPCVKCKVFLHKDTLAAHFKRCEVLENNAGNKGIEQTATLRQGKHLLSSYLNKNNPEAQRLWTNMRDDEIKEVILNDTIIRKFGETCMEPLLVCPLKQSEVNKVRLE